METERYRFVLSDSIALTTDPYISSMLCVSQLILFLQSYYPSQKMEACFTKNSRIVKMIAVCCYTPVECWPHLPLKI